MKVKRPIFWDSFNFISLLLLPFSLITIIFNFFKSLSPKKYFKIKTICVGNIYLGGTGKTPLVLKINDMLKYKFKTVFIKKKYKSLVHIDSHLPCKENQNTSDVVVMYCFDNFNKDVYLLENQYVSWKKNKNQR